MNTNRKKWLSFLLSLVMVFTLLAPAQVYAEELDQPTIIENNDPVDQPEGETPTVPDDNNGGEQDGDTNENPAVPGDEDGDANENPAAPGDEDGDGENDGAPVADDPDGAPVADDPDQGEPENPDGNDPEPVAFTKGYARVKSGAKLYEAASARNEIGHFTASSVVYAVAENDAWFWVIFDTEEANGAEEKLISGYVAAASVTGLAEADADAYQAQLEAQKNKGVAVRAYSGNLLGFAGFAAAEAEEPENPAKGAKGGTRSAITITSQPDSDIYADVGQSITLSVTATGGSGTLRYTWYYQSATGTTWTSGGTSRTKTITFKASLDGRKYKCEVTDTAGNSAETGVITLHDNAATPPAPAGITITSQPASDIYADVDQNITLSVTATGGSGTLRYTWYYQSATGTTWTAGGTTRTKTITFKASLDGRKYKCEVTDTAGNSAETGVITLHNNAAPVPADITITSQPDSDIYADVNQSITLSVSATGGSGTLRYTWYYQNANVTTWTSAGTGASKTITFKASLDGRKYKCEVTDTAGNSAATGVITLHDNAATPPAPAEVTITSQPDADIYAEADQVITLSVTATGGSGKLTYTWYYQSATGTTWTAGGTGQNKTITFKATMDGRKYKCIVTDQANGSAETEVTTLHNGPEPITIIDQPAFTDIYAEPDEVITLSVNATGGTGTLRYTWYYQLPNGTTWTAGGTSKTRTITFKATMDGRKYKCIVTDAADGSAETGVITLHNGPEPAFAITVEPQDLTVGVGTTVTLHVEAVGVGPMTFQWYYKDANDPAWAAAPDGTPADWTFDATDAMDGCQYYCKVTDGYGAILTTTPITLTIGEPDVVYGDFVLAKTADETGWILKQYTGTDTTVVVPATYENLPITVIGAGAFEGNTNLQSIDLPSTITIIGERAFKNCVNLRSME